MFQVCDARRHALIEAHVRCYAIRRSFDHLSTGLPAYYQPFNMRLQHPDDELGGMLLLNLPNTVVHALDAWSPLIPNPSELCKWRPRSARRLGVLDPQTRPHMPMSENRFPDVLLREIDCMQGNRTMVSCATCGESYETHAQLQTHIQRCELDDQVSGWNQSLSCVECGECYPSRRALFRHRAASKHGTESNRDESAFGEESTAFDAGRHRRGVETASTESWAAQNRELVSAWLQDTQTEIVVVLEGIDATTSYTVQARHSYTYEELVWGHIFAPTMAPSSDSRGGCIIDFTKVCCWQQLMQCIAAKHRTHAALFCYSFMISYHMRILHPHPLRMRG